METIAINGSPRKKGNSAAMLKSWLEGAKEAKSGFGVQWIDCTILSSTASAAVSPASAKMGVLMANVR